MPETPGLLEEICCVLLDFGVITIALPDIKTLMEHLLGSGVWIVSVGTMVKQSHAPGEMAQGWHTELL